MATSNRIRDRDLLAKWFTLEATSDAILSTTTYTSFSAESWINMVEYDTQAKSLGDNRGRSGIEEYRKNWKGFSFGPPLVSKRRDRNRTISSLSFSF